MKLNHPTESNDSKTPLSYKRPNSLFDDVVLYTAISVLYLGFLCSRRLQADRTEPSSPSSLQCHKPVVEPVVAEEDADEDDIAEHLRNCGRGDLQIYVDEFTGSIEKCVKLLLEKYPVKRISKKQYKPADDIA